MSAEGPGTILGGLPVVAVITGGKDPDTPNGPGEYWSEVVSIHWMKRDGSKGKEIPDHIRERAEAYDCAFCDLTQQVWDHLIYEQDRAEHPDGETVVTLASDSRLKPLVETRSGSIGEADESGGAQSAIAQTPPSESPS